MLVFNPIRCPILKSHLTYRLTYVLDARKRHRKSHDKSWKCEEKRGSKEHRKASAGHQREWNPDAPNDASAPPNLSDGRIIPTKFALYFYPVNLTFGICSCDVVRISTSVFVQLPER